jgi:hypothetical protein
VCFNIIAENFCMSCDGTDPGVCSGDEVVEVDSGEDESEESSSKFSINLLPAKGA